MSDPPAPAAAADLVRRIVEHLQAAARAAAACVKAGDTDQALALLREIEAPLYEVTTLLNAAGILRGDHAE